MEILKSEPVYMAEWWTLIVFLLLAIPAAALWGSFSALKKQSFLTCALVFSCAAIVWLVMLINGFRAQHLYDRVILRVSDDITVNELYKKYEIERKDEYANVYYVKEYPHDFGN